MDELTYTEKRVVLAALKGWIQRAASRGEVVTRNMREALPYLRTAEAKLLAAWQLSEAEEAEELRRFNEERDNAKNREE